MPRATLRRTIPKGRNRKERAMKGRMISPFRVVFVIALGMTFAMGVVQTAQPVLAAGSTCGSIECSPSTHCCFNCGGLPICVKKHTPCPECAPV